MGSIVIDLVVVDGREVAIVVGFYPYAVLSCIISFFVQSSAGGRSSTLRERCGEYPNRNCCRRYPPRRTTRNCSSPCRNLTRDRRTRCIHYCKNVFGSGKAAGAKQAMMLRCFHSIRLFFADLCPVGNVLIGLCRLKMPAITMGCKHRSLERSDLRMSSSLLYEHS